MTTFESGGKPITVDLFLPVAGGLHPAVVVAYGTEGLGVIRGFDAGAAIRDFAGYLANTGFVVFVPYYFERTQTPPGLQTVLPVYARHRDEWLDTLGDCLSYAASRTTDVDQTRLGLLGFSLGGHLALRRAKDGAGTAIKAVVEFFAPISTLPGGLGDRIGSLPPLQIHHGGSDPVVANTQSDELEGLLVAAGKVKGVDYERHNYPGEGHGFRGVPAIKSSKQRTADFFKKHLGK
jgi:dienelactone hydrolase